MMVIESGSRDLVGVVTEVVVVMSKKSSSKEKKDIA